MQRRRFIGVIGEAAEMIELVIGSGGLDLRQKLTATSPASLSRGFAIPYPSPAQAALVLHHPVTHHAGDDGGNAVDVELRVNVPPIR